MRAKVQEIVKTLKETGKEKINTTDNDSVNGKTRQGSHAIINCEVTTDEKHGLIVNGEAVSQNNDLNQLSSQAEQCTETFGKPPAQVVSDSGYFSLKDILREFLDLIQNKVSEKIYSMLFKPNIYHHCNFHLTQSVHSTEPTRLLSTI